MSKKAFDKIMEGMDDAIAFAGGDESKGRVAKPVDVKAIRIAHNMTQAKFAKTYKLPIGTVRDWEQKRRQPDAPARALLTIIERDPEAAEKLLAVA